MNIGFKSHSFLLLTLALTSFPSYAYMGPGAGITAIGCLIALFAGIWYTFKGFLWLPLKRMLNKNKSTELANNDSADDKAPTTPKSPVNNTK